MQKSKLITSTSLLALLAFPMTVLAYSAPVENRSTEPVSQSYVEATSTPAEASSFDQQPLVSANTPIEPTGNNYSSQASSSAQQQYAAPANHADASNVLARLDRLEQEVRELRGQVELQAHTIAQLKTQPNSGSKGPSNQMPLQQSTSNSHYAPPENSVSSIQDQPSVDAEPGVSPLQGSQSNELGTPIKTAETNDGVLTEQKTYQDAYDLLINKQYSKAKPALQDYIAEYPSGQFSVNAHYWLGEVSLLEGDTKSASKEFKLIINDYASSSKAPDAMLKLGFIYADEGKWQDARKQLTEIQKKYPDSSVAQLAEQRLKLMAAQGH